jgi:tRNA-dihydrouridine synthase B
MKIPVWGNGDIDSGEKALEMKKRFGVDGIMIGRAATGNPWIFSEVKHYIASHSQSAPLLAERLAVVRRHIVTSIPYKGELTTLYELRRFYSGYFRGLPDFKKYRTRLVTANDFETVHAVLREIEMEYTGLTED